jgi:hypothetical protein
LKAHRVFACPDYLNNSAGNCISIASRSWATSTSTLALIRTLPLVRIKPRKYLPGRTQAKVSFALSGQLSIDAV